MKSKSRPELPLGSTPADLLAAHKVIQKGIRAKDIRRHLRSLGVDPSLVAGFIEVPSSKRRLGPTASDVALSLLAVFTNVVAIFGSADAALDWLSTPVSSLDGHVPLALLSTRAGTQAVRDHLVRIEFGVYC
ncbi:antitoxin Xre/MbcA/ParS toxin-binding domain-containing protein [Stagnihabitans tardus]|uniref:DUF2384 domain-containing protein n=1 Tax=Stagnihabitans tardus TaxID=2699202 RepID=A0AAE4YFZ7_9RHOB|nr:antitoxin Xre/MbcA/ParS toxin-binding domain-containing protein [Stagnihabitans tardus]NBZ89504.1 DUF2384 domain-containing protein [Stagnihabitans tardus]